MIISQSVMNEWMNEWMNELYEGCNIKGRGFHLQIWSFCHSTSFNLINSEQIENFIYFKRIKSVLFKKYKKKNISTKKYKKVKNSI